MYKLSTHISPIVGEALSVAAPGENYFRYTKDFTQQQTPIIFRYTKDFTQQQTPTDRQSSSPTNENQAIVSWSIICKNRFRSVKIASYKTAFLVYFR